MLPTQLRDKLPAVRTALLKIIWALRRLDGQVHSYDTAKYLGILPGSRSIRHDNIDQVTGDLIKGLVLLEGCLPISQLNQALHHLVHYGEYTKTHGLLRWFWMFFFERFEM